MADQGNVVTLVISGLSDNRLLYRQRALRKLDAAFKDGSLDDLPELRTELLKLLDSEAIESKQGALSGIKALLENADRDVGFEQVVFAQARVHIQHAEHRVRAATASVLGALAARDCNAVFPEFKPELIGIIRNNLERSPAQTANEVVPGEDGLPNYGESPDASLMNRPPPSLGGSPRGFVPPPSLRFQGARKAESNLPQQKSQYTGALAQTGIPGQAEAVTRMPAMVKKTPMQHDTEGWKGLETSVMALQNMLSSAGPAAAKFIDDELLTTLFDANKHTNRFVREIGFRSLGAVAEASTQETVERIGADVARELGRGLADNWSQVRYAAAVATRQFIKALGTSKRAYDDVLLPRMCISRHYVAEGVRLYSQENWKLMVGMEGRNLLAKHIAPTVDFYISQSRADNHAVREAACHSIAELATKVDKNAVRPHVIELAMALVDMFKDASWPVRDAASVASGWFVSAFPEESKEVLPELYPLWFAHLGDNIPSVRDDTAASLGVVMHAYGDEAVDRVVSTLRESLASAKQQPKESERLKTLSNTTQFGVAEKKIRDNDDELHTDQIMYSCGSLGPQGHHASTSVLKRGGGCMDHGFSRDKEPWEVTDGMVCLLRELASERKKLALEFIPTLIEMTNLHDFAHYPSLLERIWKLLPVIAKSIGWGVFETYLSDVIRPLQRTMQGGNRLAEASAKECVRLLKRHYGPEALYPL